MARKVEDVAAQVVKILYEAKAAEWTVQDKGVFLAAVKLQLAEQRSEPRTGQE